VGPWLVCELSVVGMDTVMLTILLIVVVLLLLFGGGGGYYYRDRGRRGAL
jgi:hypothetical protein